MVDTSDFSLDDVALSVELLILRTHTVLVAFARDHRLYCHISVENN